MGQDSSADGLLYSAERNLRLAIPSICLMEAISAFDWKRRERNDLSNELDRQLAQLRRSLEIPIAMRLTTELVEATLSNDKLLSELFQRLDDYFIRVATRAELLPLSLRILEHQLQFVRDTELDRDDALILATILDHCQKEKESNRAFLTGNINDFGRLAVRDILTDSNVKLFSSTERVLSWAESLRQS
jgi:hypothetical protein